MRAPVFLMAFTVGCMTFVACSDDENPTPPSSDDAGFPDQDADDLLDMGGMPDADPIVDMGAVDMGFADAGFPDGGFPDAGDEDAGFPPIDTTCDPDFFPDSACGGNLPGTSWNYVNVCGQNSQLQLFLDACVGSSVASLTRTVTGTLTMGNDNAYLMQLDDTIDAMIDIGTTCVEVFETCENAALFFRMNGIDTMCSDMGGACLCDFDVVQPVRESGTFVTSGTTVTFQSSGGRSTIASYCAANRVFRYRATGNGTTYVLAE